MSYLRLEISATLKSSNNKDVYSFKLLEIFETLQNNVYDHISSKINFIGNIKSDDNLATLKNVYHTMINTGYFLDIDISYMSKIMIGDVVMELPSNIIDGIVLAASLFHRATEKFPFSTKYPIVEYQNYLFDRYLLRIDAEYNRHDSHLVQIRIPLWSKFKKAYGFDNGRVILSFPNNKFFQGFITGFDYVTRGYIDLKLGDFIDEITVNGVQSNINT